MRENAKGGFLAPLPTICTTWCDMLSRMRRATVTIPDDLENDLQHFIEAAPAQPSLAAVVQTALRRFLTGPEDGRTPDLIRRVLGHRRQIVEAAHEHGAIGIRLFGSVARGEDTAESDLDFLVEMAEGRTLFDVARLRASLEELLDTAVDVVPSTNLGDALRAEIMNESIEL